MSADTSNGRRYEQRGWSLRELLESPEEGLVAERISELENAVAAFEGVREELTSDLRPDRLTAILADYEELVAKLYVLSAYSQLWFSEDTQSGDALAFRSRIDDLLTALQNRVLFFSLWWKGLEDEEVTRLRPAPGEYADYAHYLDDLRRFKPFTLDERSEQIVNIKNANGIDAVITLYSMLTNRLEFKMEVDGEEKTLTRDQVSGYFVSPRPELREAAYREMLRVYADEATVLGQIYVHRVRDWHAENRELRGFASAIAVRNQGNDVPDEAVSTLLDVTAESREIFQNYFRLKAGWLGMDRLRRYDLYAPLTEAERRIPYPEAVRLVLDTFDAFDPGFAARAERVFSDDHVDSEVRKGKRAGAFCATVLPHQVPWLLVNYTGKVRDTATLAHELGHAVHSLLAADHSVLTQHASLPLAETASVFAEMLLRDRLLAEESDPAVRRELLASGVDDMYATVLRQAYFVRFERDAHQAILAGRTQEELSELYLEGLHEQLGEAVDVSPEFRSEWVAIPHIFHSPFYCYSYSFGQLLVLALYKRYREEGASFVPGYLRLLSYGGSARPEEILSEVGVDMTDPDFWRGGFSVVAEMVRELEALETD